MQKPDFRRDCGELEIKGLNRVQTEEEGDKE